MRNVKATTKTPAHHVTINMLIVCTALANSVTQRDIASISNCIDDTDTTSNTIINVQRKCAKEVLERLEKCRPVRRITTNAPLSIPERDADSRGNSRGFTAKLTSGESTRQQSNVSLKQTHIAAVTVKSVLKPLRHCKGSWRITAA